MEANPFVHNIRHFGKVDRSPLPSFFDTVGATLGYAYQPIIDHIGNSIKYGTEVDRNYVSTQDMKGYEQYRSTLIHAQNAEHMEDLKRQLDANLQRRKVLAESSLTSQFFAGVFDPINFIALPFGGAGVGIARSFLRTGAGVGAIQSGQEILRAPVDPLYTPMESVFNVGAAFAAGGLLGSAISVVPTRRFNAVKETKKQLAEIDEHYNPRVDHTRPEATPERPMSQVIDEEIEANLVNIPPTVKKVEEFINQKLSRISQLKKAKDEMSDRVTDAQSSGNERVANVRIKAFNRLTQEETKTAAQLKGLREKKTKLNDLMAKSEKERIERVRDGAAGRGPDSFDIPQNAWTDSFAYKFVTTPMKRVLQDKNVPQPVKKIMIAIGGDSGILFNIHKYGGKVGSSIFQRANRRNGEWVQAHDELTRLYEQEYKLGPQVFTDVDLRTKMQMAEGLVGERSVTYQEWITSVNRKRILGEKASSDAEQQAMTLIDNYYKTWSERLESVGMLGGSKYYQLKLDWVERQVLEFEAKVNKAREKLDNLQGSKLSEKAVGNIERKLKFDEERLAKLRKKKEEVEAEIQFLKDNDFKPRFEEAFNPRYWDVEAILENIDDFSRILFDWYKNNPEIFVFDEAANKYVKKTLDPSDNAIKGRVKETIDKITGQRDVTHEEQSFFGMGQSKHLKHRELDIPNHLVADYIHLNPINVMKTYTTRIAPEYEFQVEFNTRSIDEVLDDAEFFMIESGMNEAARNKHLRDLRHMYERVSTKVLRDPNSWDQKTVTVLKDLAMLNYLGTAGLATLPDFAKIMMEHELAPIMKGLFGVMSDHKVRLSAKEARIAGEAIEILQGDAHMRLTEYMNNNPLNNGFMNRVRAGFFILNGLAPMTNIAKRFDAIMRGHTLIDYSIKWTQGTLSKKHQEYLLRYNIDLDDAKKIAESAWEKTDNGLYLPNTSKWDDVGTRDNFRDAMNSGILNTVLMGTPADKPIAVDGVFYVPMHIAQRFGMVEDPKYKGYARIENGLLGLPFQFMSYSFAAANKITASFAHNQVQNRAVAVLASMGLGYMALELKQPDFVMDKMPLQDKIARSFDMSGIAALYSDLTYTAMNTSLALGGPNITMGLLQPKFPQEQNVLDAVTGIAGAGPSYAVDVARAMGKMVSGEFSEGAYELTGRLPFATALIWNEEVKELRQALRGGRY